MSFREFPEFVKYQLPVLVWMGFIFALSSIPGSALSPIEFPHAHLIAHSLLFGALCFLAYRALKHQRVSRFLGEFSSLGAFLIVLLYGASDEYHQSFTPGRTEELKDLLIDVSAAAAVVIIVSVAEKIRGNRARVGKR